MSSRSVVHAVFVTRLGDVDTVCRASAVGLVSHVWERVTCGSCRTAVPPRKWNRPAVREGGLFGIADWA